MRLFLDNTEIVIDKSQTIKIFKENPYFTLSDTYSLDISIPMDIYQNRVFFGNIQRIGVKKDKVTFDAKLYYNNKKVIFGESRITRSDKDKVKIQITCGISALKMKAEIENLYIDKMGFTATEYTFFPAGLDSGTAAMEGFYIPLRDSTNDKNVNLCYGFTDSIITTRDDKYRSVCPSLLVLAQKIAERLGYRIFNYENDIPYACQNIYVITASQYDYNKKLPHWTVKEFFDQLQLFFGVRIVEAEPDETTAQMYPNRKYLRLLPLSTYTSNHICELEPLDDFEVDYSEDDEAKGTINSNIAYDISQSDIEVVDDTLLNQAIYKKSFNSFAEMTAAFESDSEHDKMRTVYKVNGETWIGWRIPDTSALTMKRVAPFNPLNRYSDADTVSLKIVPVFIQENVECSVYHNHGGNTPDEYTYRVNLPEVSNAFPIIDNLWHDANTTVEDSPSLYDLVTGNETVPSDDNKEDVIHVAFSEYDHKETLAFGGELGSKEIQLAFTDYNFKKQFTNNHSKFSLSLNELEGYSFYLGEMHKLSFECERKIRYKFRFLSDTIPDPTDIFIVRNKRYACEKIEAEIKDDEITKMKVGYFYEIKE